MLRPQPLASTAVVSALLVACGPASDPPGTFQLLSFRQAGDQDVCLNETLVFHFSEDLDHASVTQNSVSILGPDQRPVSGTFEISGSKLEFRPRLPLASDLLDGSFQPGMDYGVKLLGFPRPDGIRSRRGTPLQATWVSNFSTADPLLGQDVFAYPPVDGHELRIYEREIGPLDPIRITSGVGLDPRTVVEEGLVLNRLREKPEGALVTAADFEPLRVHVELEQNDHDGAVIRVRPRSGQRAEGLLHLEPGEYYLEFTAGFRPLSLSGAPVRWPGRGAVVAILVQALHEKAQVETFASPGNRLPDAVRGFDGTAFWEGDGQCRIRYPSAAGTGVLGRVETFDPTRSDTHATRILVPRDDVWDLSQREGLVVLRSQGALDVAGRLVRRRAAERGEASFVDAMRSVARLSAGLRPTLSAWLEERAADATDLTVLIAGGDLRVRGSIQVEGPLLLVAGGWIRIDGRVEAEEVWKTAPGGENAQAGRIELLPLTIDEPPIGGPNPLAVPLRLAVTSRPIHPSGGVWKWGAVQVSGGHEGIARAPERGWKVSYLGIQHGPDEKSGDLIFGPFSSLDLLDSCQAVRFRVELSMPAQRDTALWHPPFVDRVEISWIEPGGSVEDRLAGN